MRRTSTKILAFVKRNAVYLVLSFCILAIGLSVSLMLINRENVLNNELNAPIEKPDDSNNPQTPADPVVKVITFIMPVNTTISVGEYSETMVFNQTLNRYSSHKAVDFFAPEGTPVMAVYDGTIESVNTSLLQGTTIVIDHGNGLKTVYNSLLDGDDVIVGQKVTQGDVIGEVSATNRQESKDGPHLHFSVEENGQVIDPIKYLASAEK